MNIVFEGPDGAGKSTLVSAVVEHYKKLGQDVIQANHPGSTPIGQELRKLIKHREDIEIDRYTEQVLMAADYCAFINDVLIPATNKGTKVISDRSNLVSGMIYGHAGGVTIEKIETFQNISLALGIPKMHLIILHAQYESLLNRQHHDIMDGKVVECKFQNRGSAFQKKVNELYGELGNGSVLDYKLFDFVHLKFQDKLVVPVVHRIDALQSKEDVLKSAISIIDGLVA